MRQELQSYQSIRTGRWLRRITTLGALGVLSLLPHLATAAILRQPPNNLGLVAYWSLEDGRGSVATDFAGNGAAGTLTNMEATDWVVGRSSSKALDFDGVDEYVRISGGLPVTVYGTNARTIAFWFNADAFDTGTNNRMFNLSGGDGSNGSSLHIYAEDNGVAVGVTGHRFICSKNGLSTGAWYHFVLTIASGSASGSATCYINGASASKTDESGTSVTIDTIQQIPAFGAENDGTFPYDGRLDDVRVYNRALSATEAAALYSRTTVARALPASTAGLVGYWSFEDGRGSKATDFSGKGNVGTLVGNPSWGQGKFGKGIVLSSASSQYVDLGNTNNFTTGGFTLAAWFKGSSLNTTILRKRPATGNSGDVWITINPSGNVVAAIYDGTSTFGATSPLTYTDNIWHHAVSVVSTSNVTLYIDGVSVATSSNHDNAFPTTTDTWKIGGNTREGTYFDGTIDEVRIYNRAFTASEVRALYTATQYKVNASQNFNQTSGLIALHSFDGPDLNTTSSTDRSGQGVNGTLVNTPRPVVGNIGQALEFNGSSNYVTFGTTGPWKTNTSGSISAWIRLRSVLASSSAADIFTYGGAASPTGIFGLQVRANTAWSNNTRISTVFQTNTTPVSGYGGSTNLKAGEWYHVVLTGDGTTWKLYLNGTQETLVQWANNTAVDGDWFGNVTVGSPVDTSIGADVYQGTRGGYFNGRIDDVRVYNKVLTAAEVLKLYKAR